MKRTLLRLLLIGFFTAASAYTCRAHAADTPSEASHRLDLTAGRSTVLDSVENIQRISVADPRIAEAFAATPREAVIVAHAVGSTTILLWTGEGKRESYLLRVGPDDEPVVAIQRQLDLEFGKHRVNIGFEQGNVYLRGTVQDIVAADRAVAMVSSLGKVVDLLTVQVPAEEIQILLRVRFADVDRTASEQLGMNIISNRLGNTIGATSTGQFAAGTTSATDAGNTFSLSNALNIFLYRSDLNLGTVIEALQAKSLLQILAEPNVMTMSGHEATFVAGGEFPFPTLQGGGAGLGAVTIQFKEFGVKLKFTPTLTPRGTIDLQVTPEVSTLDYTNALVLQGATIPALSTRRVSTEIELRDGQSFGIAGLLDNRLTETINKIPGLSEIPLLGKFFQSRTKSRSNSELLILVTPEIVRPIPGGAPLPGVKMPGEFLPGTTKEAPRTPGVAETGPVVAPARRAIPVESLRDYELKSRPPAAPASTPPGFTIFNGIPAVASAPPATAPAPSGGGPAKQ
jgi:pilus assembly protein CpaC